MNVLHLYLLSLLFSAPVFLYTVWYEDIRTRRGLSVNDLATAIFFCFCPAFNILAAIGVLATSVAFSTKIFFVKPPRSSAERAQSSED